MKIQKERIKANNSLYKETALKHNVTPELVENVFGAICRYSEYIIKRGTYEDIMIVSFGKLKVKHKQMKFVENLRALKQAENETI